MKKNMILCLTRTLYVLFAVSTLILLWMVYKDIDTSFAFKFGIGYLFLTFFLLLYIPIITILNLRKSKRIEIKKRLLKFISLFILFGALNYTFDYVIRPYSIDLFRIISSAIGLAFGISFIDITIFKKEGFK